MSGRYARSHDNYGGFSERLLDYIVILLIIGGIVYGVHYYFSVYLRSPSVVVQNFINAMNSADAATQYSMLYPTATLKAHYPDLQSYKKNPISYGLVDIITSTNITSVINKGNWAKVTAVSAVRKPHQKIWQASTTSVSDIFILRKDDNNNWRIVLERCYLPISQLARTNLWH